MLPNMKEKGGSHCGYFGMKQVPNYGRYNKPKNGWCSNCNHEKTEYCKKKGACLGNRGHAPTGYSPINNI